MDFALNQKTAPTLRFAAFLDLPQRRAKPARNPATGR